MTGAMAEDYAITLLVVGAAKGHAKQATGQRAAVEAAANLLAPGEWAVATCITPTGRLDGHYAYVTRVDGQMVCAFCTRGL